MAFTLVTQPAIIQPVYNPIIFRVTSDIYTANNFKYMFLVYANSVIAATIKTIPDPTGVGLLNVSNILKNYIITEPNAVTTIATGQSIFYTVDCGFELAGGIVTAVTNKSVVVTLNIRNNTTNVLNGQEISSLILPGLTLSHAAPYYLKYNSGLYEVYSDALLITPVTATGTFSPNGYVQTTTTAIPNDNIIIETTTEKLAINYVETVKEFIDNSNLSSKMLTNSNSNFFTYLKEKNIAVGEYDTLTCIQNYSDNVSYFKITAYDSSNTILGSFNYNNSHSISYSAPTFTNPFNLKLIVGTGLQNLADNNPANITTNTACTYYTIQAFDISDIPLSNIQKYNIKENNCKYENVRVQWLNRQGAYDYYTFIKLDDTLKISTSIYKKNLPYNYSYQDRGNTVMFGQADETLTLATDFVDDNTSVFLSDLFTSTDVYIVDSVVTPVTVVNNSYSYKIKGKEKIKQYQIELMFANKKIFNS